MRILAAIHSPEATRDILEYLGLPSHAPPEVGARPEPELEEPYTLPLMAALAINPATASG